MLRVTTETGSIYEVDLVHLRARRVTGDASTVSKNAADGEWRNFIRIDGPVVGERLNIFWDGKLFGKARSTSPVVSIENTNEPVAMVEN